MITYCLILSKVFPATHQRAGQPTNFKASFNNARLSAYDDDCVEKKIKLHTIRGNYELWAERFKKINSGVAALSIREWDGTPYSKGSTQQEIALLTREDGIGLQKMMLHNTYKFNRLVVDNVIVPYKILASNDGLSFLDWYNWIKPYDIKKPLAVIQFTKFRY